MEGGVGTVVGGFHVAGLDHATVGAWFPAQGGLAGVSKSAHEWLQFCFLSRRIFFFVEEVLFRF